jgi:hypothetical protein
MVFLAEPGDRQLLRPGCRAHVRVHGAGTRSWAGTVSEVAQVEASQVPPQLSASAGGNVATKQDPVSRLEKPCDQHYLVAVQFVGPDPMIHPGVVGRVRVEVGSRSLWWRLRRYLGATFNWGL